MKKKYNLQTEKENDKKINRLKYKSLRGQRRGQVTFQGEINHFG